MSFVRKMCFLILFQGLYPGSYGENWTFSFPSRIRALNGSCVEIPCSFTHPKHVQPKVTWYKIKTKNIYINLTSSSTELTTHVLSYLPGNCKLRLEQVTSKDEGEYYPSINTRNEYDFSEKRILLNVTDVPDPILLKIPNEIIEGNTIDFTCSAGHTCAYHPPTIGWENVGLSVREYHMDLGEGKLRVISQLTYEASYKDHGKQVRCKVTYPNGKIYRQERKLSIKYPPKNTMIQFGKEPKEGGFMDLYCISDSNPDFKSYEWYKGAQKVKLPELTWKMTVMDVHWNSEPYSCSAVNELGREASALTKIPVQPKGVHIIYNKRADGDVELKCAFLSSRPKVTNYTWIFEANILMNQSEQILLVKKNESNSGKYSCIAQNNIGWNSSSSLLVTFSDKQPDRSIVNYPVIFGSLAAALVFILAIVILYICMRRKTKSESPVSPANGIIPSRLPEKHPPNQAYIAMDEHLYGNLEKEKSTNGDSTRDGYPNDDHLKEDQTIDTSAEHENGEDLQYSFIQHPQHDHSNLSSRVLKHSEVTEYAVVAHK